MKFFQWQWFRQNFVHDCTSRPSFTPVDEFVQLVFRPGGDDGHGSVAFILNMTRDAECDCFFFGRLAVINALYFSCNVYGDRSFQGSEADEVNDLLEIYLIRFIECTEIGAVNIQYAFHDAIVYEG